jgi:hypothetical protein
MTVGREDIFYLKALAVGIALGLLHPLERVFALFLGFQNADRQRFRHVPHLNTEQIIGPAGTFAAAAFRAGRFDRGGGFHLDPLMIVISLVTQKGVD